MAEEARREGAPGREAGAASALDPDKLTALQLDILANVHTDDATTSTAADALRAAADDVRESDQSARVSAADFVHENVPALDVPRLADDHPSAKPMPQHKIRKCSGKRRDSKVGPVGFTEPQYAELLAAADRHGYSKTISGYVGDIALAFIRGRFTVDLPLHTEQQEIQEFRAKVLYEINRIGVNINQIARVLHGEHRVAPDINERLDRLDRLLSHIAEALLIPADAKEA